MNKIYDDYLEHVKQVAESRILLDENVKKLGIPEIYLFDQRYTVLFVISEIAFRKKGFFVSSDLKSQTNLSDKSIERYIKLLLDKGFFYIKQGQDKRVKQYHPSKDLEKHMRATWEVRIKQIEAILKMSSKYEEVLEFLKKDKYVW
jgi:transcription initiation factor IIE alpha subunit